VRTRCNEPGVDHKYSVTGQRVESWSQAIGSSVDLLLQVHDWNTVDLDIQCGD